MPSATGFGADRALSGQQLEQPAAKVFTKQVKSSTFSAGGVVDWSQLAATSAAANRFKKQMKSFTFRQGSVVLASQLA
jgi:hypothetical protein